MHKEMSTSTWWAHYWVGQRDFLEFICEWAQYWESLRTMCCEKYEVLCERQKFLEKNRFYLIFHLNLQKRELHLKSHLWINRTWESWSFVSCFEFKQACWYLGPPVNAFLLEGCWFYSYSFWFVRYNLLASQ